MTPLEVMPEDFASPFEATLQWMVPDDPNGEIISYNVDIGVISTNFSSASQQGRRKRQNAIILEECILGNLTSAVSVPGTETSLTVTNLSKSLQLAISRAFVIFSSTLLSSLHYLWIPSSSRDECWTRAIFSDTDVHNSRRWYPYFGCT